jgi:hypothetical protein
MAKICEHDIKYEHHASPLAIITLIESTSIPNQSVESVRVSVFNYFRCRRVILVFSIVWHCHFSAAFSRIASFCIHSVTLCPQSAEIQKHTNFFYAGNLGDFFPSHCCHPSFTPLETLFPLERTPHIDGHKLNPSH